MLTSENNILTKFSCVYCVIFDAVTWNVTCTYSQFLARKYPSCCVSFSSFYNETITPCPTCSCGCEHKTKNCVKYDSLSTFSQKKPTI